MAAASFNLSFFILVFVVVAVVLYLAIFPRSSYTLFLFSLFLQFLSLFFYISPLFHSSFSFSTYGYSSSPGFFFLLLISADFLLFDHSYSPSIRFPPLLLPFIIIRLSPPLSTMNLPTHQSTNLPTYILHSPHIRLFY